MPTLDGSTGGRMNIYAASVALLWTTAVRAVTAPRMPPQPVGCGKRLQGKIRQLTGRDVVDGVSRRVSNG
jgi:hypothetical protein